MDLVAENSDFKNHSQVDRVGIVASILCAVHCALTPVLLILLPTFGKAWAHPSTHWGMAVIVIPIALFMMRKGYKRHGKKWIVITGWAGILFIVIGAILPYSDLGSPKTQSVEADYIVTTSSDPEGVAQQKSSPG